MKKSTITRRSLIFSVLSMLICVAMLAGSTFAWFTDTASAGVNKIQAGTLDIGLEMQDGDNWVDAEGKALTWKKASGHENEEVLWEPGCTYELSSVRVVNKGNLALKYKVVINNIDGSAKLNEAIEWTISIGGTSNTLSLGEYFLLPADATGDALTIKGHMKEDAGNEYQGLSIDGASITVYATQYTYESDMTDNQYDASALYPLMPNVNEVTEKAANVDANSKLVSDVEMADSTIPSGTTLYTDHDKADANKLTTSAINGELKEEVKTTSASADEMTVSIGYTYNDGTKDTTVKAFSTPITHVIDLSKGLTSVTVKHGDAAMTAASAENSIADGEYFYNSTTGKLTIVSSTYSDFVIKVTHAFVAATKGQGYATLEEAIAAAGDGDTVTLLSNLTISKRTEINDKDITLDANGKTVTFTTAGDNVLDNEGLIRVLGGSNVTVTGNGNFDYVAGNWYTGTDFLVYGNSTLTIKNGSYRSCGTIAQAGGKDEGTVIIYDGTFETVEEYDNRLWTLNKRDNTGSVITVYGGSFKGFDPSNGKTENPKDNFVAEGYVARESNNVWTVGIGKTMHHFTVKLASGDIVNLVDYDKWLGTNDTTVLYDGVDVTDAENCTLYDLPAYLSVTIEVVSVNDETNPVTITLGSLVDIFGGNGTVITVTPELDEYLG